VEPLIEGFQTWQHNQTAKLTEEGAREKYEKERKKIKPSTTDANENATSHLFNESRVCSTCKLSFTHQCRVEMLNSFK
jgi:hypothetical protein